MRERYTRAWTTTCTLISSKFYIKKIQVQRSSSDDQKDCCTSSKLAQAMLNPDLPNAFRGQYQPIKRLGQGNFGTCWVVHDVRDVGTTRKTPE